MTLSTTSANRAFLPSEVGDLIVKPVIATAAATLTSTVIRTGAANFRIPVVATDPSAAWVAEGAEITPSDIVLDEAATSFFKLAGLSIITRELADDASPEASAIVGDGLARDIARKLDAAYFGNTVANGPSGLGSLTGTGTVAAGTIWTDLDAFTEAIYNAEAAGASLTSFAANPADALLISKLKESTGSKRSLLQPDPTRPGVRIIAGVPLVVSPSVTPGTVWGIPQARVLTIIRNDVQLDIDRSVFFTSDRVAVRATLRVGFLFPQPAAVQKITKTA